MTDPIQVTFPWPAKELSPNSRAHWRQVAKAKKAYRQTCAALAVMAGAKQWGDATYAFSKIDVRLEFLPPDRRARDADNCLASMKAGLDGLADALGIDDKHFRVSYEMAESIGGAVRVTVNAAQAAQGERVGEAA